MVEFGLAEIASFGDPLWRPATFREVSATKERISSLGIIFLQDFDLKKGTCNNSAIHIGGACIRAGGEAITLKRDKLYKAGSRPSIYDFAHDGKAEKGHSDTLDRTSDGFLHIFVKDPTTKRRKTHDESLGEFLWRERSFPDAVVTCGQVRFEVHRAVLSQNLVFKQGLSGSMVEGRTAAFDIKDSEPVAVEALLRHIYTRQTDAPENNLVPLLALAVQYEEPDLIQAVALALANVSVDTVQAHGRALKLHRDHPHVEAAYKKFREMVCNDPDLVDKLL